VADRRRIREKRDRVAGRWPHGEIQRRADGLLEKR